MFFVARSGGEKVNITAVGQFQTLAQLGYGQRKIAYGNIGLADSAEVFLQSFSVHRRYGRYLESAARKVFLQRF